MRDFKELIQVCSMLYEENNEENPPLNVNNSAQKKEKSSIALNFTCVDDIYKIKKKELVEKFCEATSDELRRRYAYKCIILPNECDTVFDSYGSEKKAETKMKQHLLYHLEDLKDRIISGTWPPQEENSQQISPKNEGSKKSLKAEHPTGIKMPRSQSKRKKSDDCLPSKKDRKSDSVSNQLKFKPTLNTVPRKSNGVGKHALAGIFLNNEDEAVQEKTVTEEIVQDVTVEICGPLCNHTNCALSLPSTSRAKISPRAPRPSGNPFLPTSPTFKPEILLHAWAEKFRWEIEREQRRRLEFNRLTISIEHCYASVDEVKQESRDPESSKPLIPATKTSKKCNKLKNLCYSNPDVIITTPAFPYVHVPLLPNCTNVSILSRKDEDKNITASRCLDVSDAEEAGPEAPEERNYLTKETSVKHKKQVIPSSVLECVENRVNVSPFRVPNSPCVSPQHFIENAENHQKAEKERAMRYIARLKNKKKKQYQGPLECQICKHKKFTALATLLHHYRSHAGIKPFSCKQCNSTFTRKHSLNYHIMIHDNRSRFKCPNCSRKFRHPSHYKEHLRRHTGETPFVCPNCLLKFKTRNTFKRHLKMQHQKLLTAQSILDMPTVKTEEPSTES